MSLQVWVGITGVFILFALLLAYINIKRLQIDQHRAWMLRAWVWAANIISLRLILLAALHVMRVYGYVYYSAINCSEIYFIYQHVGVPDARNPTTRLYPSCAFATNQQGISTSQQVNPVTNSSTYVSVSTAGTGPENAAAATRVAFPMAAWLALVCHVLVVECYLWMTPAESYRLRNVSYQRQVEKGLRLRGSFKDAGLTNTRLGDAPLWWSITPEDYVQQQKLITAELSMLQNNGDVNITRLNNVNGCFVNH